MRASGSILDELTDVPVAQVGAQQGSVFRESFPLLALAMALFALLNFATYGSSGTWYMQDILHIRVLSGDTWVIHGGDAFLGLSLVLLFVEIVRATSTTAPSILNHAFSALVFVSALVMFVTLPGYANSPFGLFTLMTLVDFVAGFIVTTVAARRDVVIHK